MDKQIIKTERLILAPVNKDDLDIYSELFRSADITRYLPGGKPYSFEYIEQQISQRTLHWQRGFGTFVVFLREHPTVKIGYAGVEMIPEVNLADIRYAISADYQEVGYGFEAAQAVLDFVVSTGLVKVVYGVAVMDNLASVKLLQKLGMRETDARLYDSDDLITMSIEAC